MVGNCAPDPLNWAPFRATLRDPEGFDQILQVIRLFGFLSRRGAASRAARLFHRFSILGIGRVVQ
jgi:hypothetical protein